MKEEEILDELRKMLFNTQEAEDIEVLSGILYLYNKEKEKNKKLEEELITESDIGYQCAKTDYDIFYISKDKIIELLKEIQKEKDKATKHILEKDYQLAENGAIAQELGWVEGKIQSLLEEN